MELQHESVDEESELKAFNDPFEVITESFVRRRHGETDPIRISEEDDQLLASLIDSGGLEESIIRDTLSKLVSMQCVSERLALQVQEEYEFEKVRPELFLSGAASLFLFTSVSTLKHPSFIELTGPICLLPSWRCETTQFPIV